MNDVLKNILKVAETVAVASVPGAGVVDATVHAIADKSQSPVDAAPALALGAIQAIESINSHDIADEVMFSQGVAQLEAGFKMIQASLKHKDGTPAPAAS